MIGDLDPVAISFLLLFFYQIFYQQADWIYPVLTFLYLTVQVLIKIIAKMDRRLKEFEFRLSLIQFRLSLITPNVGTAAAPDERSAPGCR